LQALFFSRQIGPLAKPDRYARARLGPPTGHPENSGGAAEAPSATAAVAVLSAERMRTALSSASSTPAVLQRALSKGGAEVVEVEGTAEVPDYNRR